MTFNYKAKRLRLELAAIHWRKLIDKSKRKLKIWPNIPNLAKLRGHPFIKIFKCCLILFLVLEPIILIWKCYILKPKE